MPVGDVDVAVVGCNVELEVVVDLGVLGRDGSVDEVWRVVVDCDRKGGVDLAFVGVHASHHKVKVPSCVWFCHIELQTCLSIKSKCLRIKLKPCWDC